MLPLFKEDVSDAIRFRVDQHRIELKTFAADHNDEEFIKFLTEQMLSGIGNDLNSRFGEAKAFDLKAVQSESLEQLVLLNDRLKDLSEKSPYYMSRKEIVARRLVAVWASLFTDFASEAMGTPETEDGN